MNKLLSVLIITYNQEDYIAQTLDSIISQIHEYDYEIIIGDDHSSDRTSIICKEYAEKYPDTIKYIYNDPNLGVIKNYYNGITPEICTKLLYYIRLALREKEYSLVAISKKINFSPKDYGITPIMIHTGCYRGYYCEYTINDDIL